MKKLFTLLTLLLCAVTSSWASTVDDLTSITAATTIKMDGLNGTDALENGTLYSSNRLLSLGGNGYSSAKGSTTYSETSYLNCYQIKDSRQIALKIGFNAKITIVGNTNSGRSWRIGTTSAGNEIASSANGASSASGDVDGSVTPQVVYINATSDLYLGAIIIEAAAVDLRSNLTLSFTPDDQIIGVGGDLTTTLSWTEDTSSESAKYTTTYASNDAGIATVDASGVVTGVAAGTATITATVTAAADATYKTTKATIKVNVNAPLAKHANILLPTNTLDFSNAATASGLLSKSWVKDLLFYGNDGADNYIEFGGFAGYQSSPYQTWMAVPANGSSLGGSSASGDWSAIGVFRGSGEYSSNKFATTRSDRAYTFYSYRVKGSSKFQTLVKAGSSSKYIIAAAFEITAGTPAGTTILYKEYKATSAGIVTLNLEEGKEYLIAVYCSGDSNSSIYELAFFYDDATILYESITTEKQYSTYITKHAVDFSGLGVKAYVATAASASAVSLDEVTTVPANTPLLLIGTTGTYAVPFVNSASAPGTNLLKAGDGTTSIGGGSKYDYVLNNGKFCHASPAGPVAVGKAYLHLDADPAGARGMELDLDFGDGVTAIKNIKVGTEDNVYYDLQGRRVLYPTKGLYIVNGKKVVIK